MTFSKEWADHTFQRATWWNRHPDRVPNDFGEPHKTDPKDWEHVKQEDELKRAEEWERLKLSDIELDSIY